MKIRNISYTKLALTLSAILFVVWLVLGTGTSLAWFKDTTPVQKNTFFVGELDLEVYYKNKLGEYERVERDSSVFDDSALYEPGYVQVVRLKVENEGNLPFDMKLALSVVDYRSAVNVFGQSFNLQDHIRFGIVTATNEAELEEMIAYRSSASEIASCDMPLSTYTTESISLGAGETLYTALIVRMPEGVNNVANYDGGVVPRVELGLVFKATQKGIPDIED